MNDLRYFFKRKNLRLYQNQKQTKNVCDFMWLKSTESRNFLCLKRILASRLSQDCHFHPTLELKTTWFKLGKKAFYACMYLQPVSKFPNVVQGRCTLNTKINLGMTHTRNVFFNCPTTKVPSLFFLWFFPLLFKHFFNAWKLSQTWIKKCLHKNL